MAVRINDFVNDLAQLNFQELANKYKGKIPRGTKIEDVVKSLEKHGFLGRLVRNDWKNDGKDKDGIYLIRAGDSFEVFTGERGIKNWKQEFTDIRSACTSFIDALLNELHHVAEDSKIE